MKRQSTIRTETIGLYRVTTTSRPATIEELLKPDEPLPRVREWLETIGRSIAAIRRSRKQYTAPVRTNAEQCSTALTKLDALMRGIEKGSACDLRTVALAIERSADLAEQWQRLIVNAGLEVPVKKHAASSRTGKGNLEDQNAKRQRDADAAVSQAFLRWRTDPCRQDALRQFTLEQQLRKYRAIVRLPKRTRDRLGHLLRDDKLK